MEINLMTNTEDGPQFAHLSDKEPTDLHKRFTDWLVENVGMEEDEVDLKTVQLACSLRIEFQKSPENQAALEARRAGADDREAERLRKAEERAAKREEAAAAKIAKATAAKEAKEAAKAAAPANEDEGDAKPATRRRRGAAAPAPAAEEEAPKPSSRRRRAKAAPVVAEPVEDFDEDDEL